MDVVDWYETKLADHEKLWAQYAERGYRTVSLCAYGTPADVRVACVMALAAPTPSELLAGGAEQHAAEQHVVETGELGFGARLTALAADGWAPFLLTATGSRAGGTFAAVLRRDPAAVRQYAVGIGAVGFANMNAAMMAGTAPAPGPMILSSYATYAFDEPDLEHDKAGTDRGAPLFVACWVPNPDLVAWNCDLPSLNDADTQARAGAFAAGFARVAGIAVLPAGDYLALVRDDSAGGSRLSTGLQGPAAYAAARAAMRADGYAPACVAAQGPAGSALFAAVFQREPAPLRRTFAAHPAGGVNPIPAIDAEIERMMQANDLRGASIAIVKGTRLAYAMGYTYAESAYPPVTATTYFRQASVSKTFAAAATYQLVAQGRLDLDQTTVVDVLGTLGLPPPADPNFAKITVRNLLEMNSGVDPNTPVLDQFANWASPLPATVAELVAAAEAEPLPKGYPSADSAAVASTPTPPLGYNNGGYFLLGLIVASLRGAKTFADALEPLFLDLQIGRVREARSLLADQPQDEARYHDNAFGGTLDRMGVAHSVMSSDRPLVPTAYGPCNLENGGGAGGLSAAAVDVARLLAALMLPQSNGIFDQATMAQFEQMFANAAACTAAADARDAADKDFKTHVQSWGFHGFDGCNALPGGGYEAWKGGSLSCSQNAIYLDTAQQIATVVCWNGNLPTGPQWYPSYPSLLNLASIWLGDEDWFPGFGMPALVPLPPGLEKPAGPVHPVAGGAPIPHR